MLRSLACALALAALVPSSASAQVVYTWGRGTSGQLGNGTTTSSNAPVPVFDLGLLGGMDVSFIAAGGIQGMAIVNGQAVDWGGNNNGQLGIGSTTLSTIPVYVSTAGVLNGLTITAVAGGDSHSLALAGNGQVYAWGYNAQGQLGNGTTTQSTVPVTVTGLSLIMAIAAGSSHSLALDKTGHIYAWGYNASGQLGNGTTVQSTVPVPVTGVLAALAVSTIAAGGDHNLAIANGQVYSWGLNANGQLGNNSTTNSSLPVAVTNTGVLAGQTATAIAGGAFHSLALAGGHVYAWGGNTSGQLGDGTTTQRTTPVAVASPLLNSLTVTKVAASAYTSFALTSTGRLFAWGDNGNGELGLGGTNAATATPQEVFTPHGTPWANVEADASGQFVVATAAAAVQRAYAWGRNNYGQLGNGTTTPSNTPVAVSTAGVLNGMSITTVAGGALHSLALANGQVFAWGYNVYGQLGNGTTTDSSVPVAVSTAGVLAGKTVTAIAGGDVHSMALANGQVFAWGSNAFGQLGNGTTANSSVPVAVSTAGVLNGKTVTAIASGGDHSLALANGQVFAWGSNFYGQLGNGSNTNSNVPVAVSTAGVLNGMTITAVAAGSSHSLTLAGGKVYAWGSNFYGQLGNGTTTDSSVPVAVSTAGVLAGKTVTAIAGGLYHSLALANGQVFAWGYNFYGQLGNGTITSSSVPVAVSSALLNGLTVTKVAASPYSSYALTDEGRLFAWGYNVNGELGIGSATTAFSTPQEVVAPVGTYWSGIDADALGNHAVATTARLDQVAFSFGNNGNGQLGTGTTTNSTSPAAVTSASALSGKVVAAVAGGAGHSLALAQGKVYAWGAGGSGQLGNGTSTDSTAPVAVSTTGVLNGLTVTAIAGGAFHSLALASGQVFAWGANNNGQLGNGSNAASNVPVAVSTSGVLNGAYVTAIAAGYIHSLALANGQVYAWGYNTDGRLGNGSSAASNVPVAVSTAGVLNGVFVTAIAAGGGHSLAVGNGKVYAWGAGGSGQLGNGSNTDSNIPVAVSTAGVLNGLTVAAVAAGTNHNLALANGQVYTWGRNTNGQLGNGSTTDSGLPVAVSSATLNALTVTKVAAGGTSSYALTDGGRLFAWGSNSSGELGLGTATTSFTTPQEVFAPSGFVWTDIDANDNSSHVVLIASPVPEPGSILLAAGLAAGALRLRRRLARRG